MLFAPPSDTWTLMSAWDVPVCSESAFNSEECQWRAGLRPELCSTEGSYLSHHWWLLGKGLNLVLLLQTLTAAASHDYKMTQTCTRLSSGSYAHSPTISCSCRPCCPHPSRHRFRSKLFSQTDFHVATTGFIILRIARVCQFVSQANTEVLMHVFIASHLNYCNALFSALPKKNISSLKLFQNSATF